MGHFCLLKTYYVINNTTIYNPKMNIKYIVIFKIVVLDQFKQILV